MPRTTSHRKVRSTRRKDGKVIHYKYPNTWGVNRKFSRKIPTRGRDLKMTDADIKRINQLGGANWQFDPITGKEVLDAYEEDPPRPDRDSHVYLPNRKLEAWEDISQFLREKDSVYNAVLHNKLYVNGHENPTRLIYYFKKRGWIEEDKMGRISLVKSNSATDKTRKFFDKYSPDAIVFNIRSAKAKDIQYMNDKVSRQDWWNVTSIGDNLIYYDSGSDEKWKREFSLFQLHDQSVASDKYRPIVFKRPGTFRGPTLVYSDLDGNGLLIKNLDTDLYEAQGEIDALKLGRYIGAGVPRDARVVQEHGDYYLIEKLIPRHQLWDNVDSDLQRRAVKDSPGQAGKAAVFYNVAQLTDRHGHNIMITRRGDKINISDIDFGFVDWTSHSTHTPTGDFGVMAERKPPHGQQVAFKKYESGRREAINRITKLVHSTKVDDTFKNPRRLKDIAELRKRGAMDIVTDVQHRDI